MPQRRDPALDPHLHTGSVPDLFRAARRRARLSQREVAIAAGLPQTTVARIEAAVTGDPAISTVIRVFAACRMRLAVVDHLGELVDDHPDAGLRDGADRHYPAHLETWRVTSDGTGSRLDGPPDSWWGFGHVAWFLSDRNVPDRSYSQWRRPDTRP